MAATMPPMASIFLDVIPSATFDFIGESFDKVGAAERIDQCL